MAARAIRVPLAIEAALADQIAAVAHAQLTAGRLRLHGNLRGPQAARRTLSLQFSAPLPGGSVARPTVRSTICRVCHPVAS